jgi:hypothetical protein
MLEDAADAGGDAAAAEGDAAAEETKKEEAKDATEYKEAEFGLAPNEVKFVEQCRQ